MPQELLNKHDQTAYFSRVLAILYGSNFPQVNPYFVVDQSGLFPSLAGTINNREIAETFMATSANVRNEKLPKLSEKAKQLLNFSSNIFITYGHTSMNTLIGAEADWMMKKFVKYNRDGICPQDFELDEPLSNVGLSLFYDEKIGDVALTQLNRYVTQPFPWIPSVRLTDVLVQPLSEPLADIPIANVHVSAISSELKTETKVLSQQTEILREYLKDSPPFLYTANMALYPECVKALKDLSIALAAGNKNISNNLLIRLQPMTVNLGSTIGMDRNQIKTTSFEQHIYNQRTGQEYTKDQLARGEHYGPRNRYVELEKTTLSEIRRTNRNDYIGTMIGLTVDISEYFGTRIYPGRLISTADHPNQSITFPNLMKLLIRDQYISTLEDCGNLAEKTVAAYEATKKMLEKEMKIAGMNNRDPRWAYTLSCAGFLLSNWPYVLGFHSSRVISEMEKLIQPRNTSLPASALFA
jgi:hypothetical protein